ncbi:MAG: hypothetical protein IJZ54_02600 [Clostridia bacterium]|nr:hypothetical protein [Clostridia bacterium]
MKRFLCVFFVLLVIACFMSGCATDEPEKVLATSSQDKLEIVEQVGEFPQYLRSVVEYNIFYGVTAFSDRVLRAQKVSEDEESNSAVYDVSMIDFYGNKLASYSVESDNAYSVKTLTATEDGGFLFVLGFSDYVNEENIWASERGVCSRVIKCDASGKLKFDTGFEGVEGWALRYCIEANKKYYLFGTKETPETKVQGVGSPTDIYMTVLSCKGEILKTVSLGGSDYDSLEYVKKTEDGFVLYARVQSNDGDFVGVSAKGYPVDYTITVNDELEVMNRNPAAEDVYYFNKIGERKGEAILSNDGLFSGFDAGRPTAYMEYKDFYLIVSENNTGEYENTPPFINSRWYYTETVYSGYDYKGNLLFRTSVDSSPDFDARVDRYNSAFGKEK